jgi:hypothetical protein
MTLRACEELSTLCGARRKEYDRAVSKRSHMRKVTMWDRPIWRRPALGPKKSPSARGRASSIVDLVTHAITGRL